MKLFTNGLGDLINHKVKKVYNKTFNKDKALANKKALTKGLGKIKHA